MEIVEDYIKTTHNTNIYIQQVADVDLGGGTLAPLAAGEASFAGHYDGGGYTIKNGTITSATGTQVGLFANLTGTVTRLCMENITVSYQQDNAEAGAIAGRLSGTGSITNCRFKNITVANNDHTGGTEGAIVGAMADGTTVTGCLVTNTTKAICGNKSIGTAEHCYTLSTTDDAFRLRRGEICYLLNGSTSTNTVWRQAIGTDALPVPDSSSPTAYYYDEQSHTGYTNEATATLVTMKVQDVAFNNVVTDYKAFKGSLVSLADYVPVHAGLTLTEWNTQADFTGTSYTPDANLLLSSDVIVLYPKWNVMPKVVTGEGTEQNPYIINSTEDWNALATNITYFNSTFNGYLNKHIRLDANISVTEMVGTNRDNPFRGTFDGYGHTLTVSIGTAEAPIAERFCGPFRYTYGATIKNLKTTGDIYTSNINAGGVVGRNGGASIKLENVSSDVAIHSTFSGAGYHGGLVGYAINASFTSCAFTGKLLGANSHHIGGLLGQKTDTANSNAYFTNCLFAPAEVTVSTAYSYPFAAGATQLLTIASNCYNTAALGNAQGTLVQTTATDNELNRKVTICNTTVYVVEVCTVSGIDANYDLRTTNPVGTVNITPTMTAPGGSIALTLGTDYTATLNGEAVTAYPIAINEVGNYTLVLTGTGSYEGSKTYQITVIGDHVLITLSQEVGTYSCDEDLNFTGSELKAYIAAGYNKSENQVLLVRVYDVPAGTGIFLRGEAGESYNISKTTSQSYYVNMLKANLNAGPIAQTEGSMSNFLLAKVNSVFKFCAPSANATLGANKAYLQVPTAFVSANLAHEVDIVFEEDAETTSLIEHGKWRMENEAGAWYDLQGRPVAPGQKPSAKGLYIVNGRKKVVK